VEVRSIQLFSKTVS